MSNVFQTGSRIASTYKTNFIANQVNKGVNRLFTKEDNQNLVTISTSDDFLISFYSNGGLRANQEVSMDTEITEHYAEDNSLIQEASALKSIRYKLNGYVGEVFQRNVVATSTENIVADNVNRFVQNTVSTVEGKLQPIQILDDALSAPQSALINRIHKASQTAGTIANFAVQQARQTAGQLLDETISSGSDNTSNIAKVETLLNTNRQKVVSVQTPFRFYPAMMMESIKLIKDGVSPDVMQVEIVFKEWKTANTQTTIIDPQTFQNRAKDDMQPIVNQGIAKIEELDVDDTVTEIGAMTVATDEMIANILDYYNGI